MKPSRPSDHRSLLALSLVTSVTASAQEPGAPAPTQPPTEQESARSHFRVGQLMYGEGRFDEAAVLAVRGGDVIGDHTVHLLGQGERLELTHRATNRELFARGAIAAARVIAKKPPGRYTMSDVVGGSDLARGAR